MVTLMICHEVDDVEHWLASPKREELFGPLGIKVRTFRDPQGSNRIGLIVETPDVATWHKALQNSRNPRSPSSFWIVLARGLR